MMERFWEYVDKTGGEDACWLWIGPISNAGYGRFTDFWQKYSAHRIAYESSNGPIPPGMVVCHSCDVRACVNPAHLWVGTHSDNMRDAYRKGRLVPHAPAEPLRGSANAMAKLTEEQVVEIRRRYANRIPRRKGSDVTYDSLAVEHGVSKSLIHAIIERRVWQHV